MSISTARTTGRLAAELSTLEASLADYSSAEAAMRLRAMTELGELLDTDGLLDLLRQAAASTSEFPGEITTPGHRGVGRFTRFR
ncbi:MAG: hypothetical protein KKE02_11585 [Alphaproteobacteria bacterium]|nr:hypothetical protein [Alphaproteobacteria bacterium]MBU1517166.1 hypothetical protein [Alphaproteobacteria bacterium]MBU2096501.1 hypothetical protein [Alphaproteobacteria bacterium]MBU2151653.1 hypothetical protein [Alphaproteobacteria bacterium]MBU2305469.1 hypothetical protein [Alphaproteobacteria bacterium]